MSRSIAERMTPGAGVEQGLGSDIVVLGCRVGHVCRGFEKRQYSVVEPHDDVPVTILEEIADTSGQARKGIGSSVTTRPDLMRARSSDSRNDPISKSPCQYGNRSSCSATTLDAAMDGTQ